MVLGQLATRPRSGLGSSAGGLLVGETVLPEPVVGGRHRAPAQYRLVRRVHDHPARGRELGVVPLDHKPAAFEAALEELAVGSARGSGPARVAPKSTSTACSGDAVREERR